MQMCKFWTKKRDEQGEAENPKSLIIYSSSPFALPTQVFSIYSLPDIILHRLPHLRDFLSPIPLNLANPASLFIYISDVTGKFLYTTPWERKSTPHKYYVNITGTGKNQRKVSNGSQGF